MKDDKKRKEIIKALSLQRLRGYIRTSDLENSDFLIKRYQLDIKLSQSFYPALHIIEITLRNQTFKALESYLGNDWLLQNKLSKRIFRKLEFDKVNESLNKLKRSKKPIETSNLIAELSFGYWTSLFTSHYEFLWREKNLLRVAFPNMPRYKLKRKNISIELNKIRGLRNRIFHYEPIWHWSDLPEHHKRISSVIQWMNNETYNLLKSVDTFPIIFKTVRSKIFS